MGKTDHLVESVEFIKVVLSRTIGMETGEFLLAYGEGFRCSIYKFILEAKVYFTWLVKHIGVIIDDINKNIKYLKDTTERC